MYGFCLSFTANLSKKIHAKNLKIFFKKQFSSKNLFLGYEKPCFFLGGGGIPRKKCLGHQKKRRMIVVLFTLSTSKQLFGDAKVCFLN